jgi:hypothetical protein
MPRREGRAERRAKSSRATELGIAGHQAAMAALKPQEMVRAHVPTSDFAEDTERKQ